MPRPLPRTVSQLAALLLLAVGGVQAHAQSPDQADTQNGDVQQAEAAPVTPSYALTEDEKAGRRTIDVVVYGDDACPTTDDGTIIVCARRPEQERFRIPKGLRDKEKEEAAHAAPAEQGWGSRAMATEASGRAFLPNSCSPIGSNGSTGCTQAMLQQWYAEMRKAGKLGPIFGK